MYSTDFQEPKTLDGTAKFILMVVLLFVAAIVVWMDVMRREHEKQQSAYWKARMKDEEAKAKSLNKNEEDDKAPSSSPHAADTKSETSNPDIFRE